MTTFKLNQIATSVVIFWVALLPQISSALPGSGSIPFSGNVAAHENSVGNGTVTPDYNSAARTTTFNEATSNWDAIIVAGAPWHAVDNGSCCVLLGLGLIALRIFGAFRKGKDNDVR